MKKILSIVCLFGSLFSNAQSGAALNFDRVDDQVALNSFSISGTSARTIEFWIKTTNTGGFQTPFASGSENPSGAFNFKVTPSGYLGLMGFANDIYPSSGTYIADNAFHHVAITYDGTTAKGYVDGNHEWDFTANLNTIGDDNYLGRSNHAGFEQYFGGTIDELRIWNVVRTQCEIISYKNCEIPTTMTGLVANYHFNEGIDMVSNPSVTFLTDDSGNANDGTLSNFALTGSTSNWVAPGGVVSGFSTSIACPVASALNFDGVNDYVAISSTSLLSMTNAVTIEAWVKTTGSPTGEQYIISKSDDSYYMALNVAGNIGKASFFINGVSSGWLFSNATNITDNNWHHIASTYNGAVIKIYIDGVLDNSVSASGAIQTGGSNVNFGCRNNSLFLQGSIDEARIWDVARTQCEINTYMNCEIPVTATGLVANYHFNQGLASYSNPSETTLLDVSGNGNNGTLGNFSLTASTSNWIAPGGVANGYTLSLPALAAIKGVNNALCNGGVGSATVIASGGTAPYTYLWSTGATTSVTALMAGAHSATITDAASCTTIKNMLIAEPTVITASATASSILCNGGVADVTVTATGGTLPYVSANTYTAMAGTTTYTVKDNNGCTTTTSITITEPTVLTAGSAASSILCNGGVASVTIIATGGTAFYAGVGTYTALAGTTTYTVTDANGCMVTTSITLNEPAILSAGSAASSILCNGGFANVTVTATGGTASYTGVGTYTTMAGTTTYTITDANGCMATTSITVTGPAAIVSSQTISICAGQSVMVGTNTYTTAGIYSDVVLSIINGCDSTITTDLRVNSLPVVTVNSGAICAGQSFTMVPGGAVTYTYSSGTDLVMPTSDATYTVTGADAVGCENMAVSSVTVNTLPTITVNSDVICAGQSFTMIPSGAVTYTYSNGDDVVMPASDNTYTVTGTDANGCENMATSSVTVNTLPIITVNSEVICAGQSFTMTPSGAITYTYSNGSDVAMPTSDVTYTVTGTDVNGCENTATSSVTVNALPTLTVMTTNTIICSGETATLTVSGASTYVWSTGETASSIAVAPTSQSTYTVNGKDTNGCTNMETITQDVSLCTGVASISNTSLFNIYPNPNNGLFMIDLNTASQVTIENALGQIILTETMTEGKNSLNIQNQSRGIYFVKVIQDGKQHTIKLIKE